MGLVDLYDILPIDTWFYLTKSNEGRLLFCRIRDFVKQHAINTVEVNCVDCLKWFDPSEGEAESQPAVNITYEPPGLGFFLKKLYKKIFSQ